MSFLGERKLRIFSLSLACARLPPSPGSQLAPASLAGGQPASTERLLSWRVQWQPQQILSQFLAAQPCPPLKGQGPVTAHCPHSPHSARLPSYLEGCFSFLPDGQDVKSNHLVLFVLPVDHRSHTPQHRGLRAESAALNAPGSPV